MHVHGCYGPNPDYLGPGADEAATDAAGHTGTDTEMEGAPSDAGDGDSSDGDGMADPSDTGNISDASDDDGADDSGESVDTVDSGDTADSGDTGGANCADDEAQPGELCFVVDTVLALPVQSMAAGDFDLNGHMDLGVASKDDLRVLFGDGTGNFPLQHDLPEDNGDYFDAGAGDLDGDGDPDLVFSNFAADTVVFHASNGNKTFAPPKSSWVGEQPLGLSIAMLDDDDRLDIVVANKGSDTVAVLINEGWGGEFEGANHHWTHSDEPRRLVVGHFDAGPSLDIAVANRNGEDLSVFLGWGNGGFGQAQVDSLDGKPRDLVAADFDLDGVLDLALVLEDADEVEVAFGDGFGEFGGEHLEIPVGNKPVALAVIDLDSDGALDLVVLNHDDSDVGVLFGDSEDPGEFLAQQTVVGLSNFSGLAAVLVADLNGDGLADLAFGGDELRTLISNP